MPESATSKRRLLRSVISVGQLVQTSLNAAGRPAISMGLRLCRGIRERYPEWRLLVDGDGGDENLKDYPIEENAELTIRSVVNNRMLYQEGWGVESIKHSLTYSGGYSRAEANARLSRNHGVVASFSRALTEGLSAQQSDEEFDAALDAAISSIFAASNT